MLTAQSIPLIASFVIARIYGPAEFGVYAIWWGYVSIASVVVTGRLEHAFGLAEVGQARYRLVATAVLLVFFISVPLAILFVVFASTGLLSLSMPPPMACLIVPAALFVSLSQIWQSLAACDGKFRELSIIRISQALSVALLQVLAGAIFPSASMLALAHAVGALLGVSLSVTFIRLPIGSFPSGMSDSLIALRNTLSRYRKFPLYSLPADGLNTVAGQLPLFILQARFGSDVAGWTALAMRIFGAPVALLGGAIRDVFKNVSSEAFIAKGDCKAEYLHTLKVLCLCSAIAVPLFMMISEPLFSKGYGENWRMAGTICAWLTPMFAMRFIASPLSYTMYLAEKQKYDLAWQAALLLFTLGAFSVPASYKNALLIYSAGYGLMYGVYCMMSFHFSKGKPRP